MSVYVIGQLKFTNEERYRQYQARFSAVFKKYSGQLLAADEHPVVLEGDWRGDKVVVMSFPSDEDARRFLQSEEYSAISVDRKAGAESTALLVRGLG